MQNKLIAQKVIVAVIGSVLATSSFAGPRNRAAKDETRVIAKEESIGLGISFNSTLVALTLSIFLMYILHEIQLSQERLTLDIENYAEEELISRLHST